MMTLSQKWRISQSKIQRVELANAIRSLNQVIGTISNTKVSVAFGPSSRTTNGIKIELDASLALKNSPIAPEDFDILVGMAAHEAAHVRAKSCALPIRDPLYYLGIMQVPDSDEYNTRWIEGKTNITRAKKQADYRARVKNLEIKRTNSIISLHKSGELPLPKHITAIGEEIFVDHFVRNQGKIIAKYLDFSRESYSVVDKKSLQKAVESRGLLLQTWLSSSIYRDIPTDLPDEVWPRLSLLYRLVDTRLKEGGKENIEAMLSYSARCAIYDTAYCRLVDLILEQEEEKEVKAAQEKSEYGEVELEDETGGHLPDTSGLADEEEEEEEEETTPGETASNQLGDGDKSDSGNTDNLGKEDNVESGEMEEVNETNDDPPHDDLESSMPFHHDKVRLPEKLQKEVEEALANDTQDITEEIKTLLSDNDASRLQNITYEKASTRDMGIGYSDQKLARELGWLRDYKNIMSKSSLLAEPEGKIDQRRLHRAMIDGKAFKKIVQRPQQKQDIVLLLDASSSMQSNQKIYEACAAIKTVLPQVQILSYKSSGGNLVIYHHTKDAFFRQVRPSGNTPSGLALVVAASRYPNSMIIHFTDGMSNSEVSPEEAFKIISENFPKIKVTTISYHGNINQYQNTPNKFTCVQLAEISDFPRVLREVLQPYFRVGR